jgi:hypothetical protein
VPSISKVGEGGNGVHPVIPVSGNGQARGTVITCGSDDGTLITTPSDDDSQKIVLPHSVGLPDVNGWVY